MFKLTHKKTSIIYGIFFLSGHKITFCGYSKEPSRWDDAHKFSKHIAKLTQKKISIIYAYLSYLASKSHVVSSQRNPLDEMIPTNYQNTTKQTHKKTSIIYANFSYLATKSHVVGTQRDDSHKLSKH